MPTVSQLPEAGPVDPADLVPISQSGTLRAVSTGSLLAGTQPAIMAATGNLLGRLSVGPGGPEPIEIGIGLQLQSGSIVANGEDHAGFPVDPSPADTDQFVMSTAGGARLLALANLRSLLSSGSAALNVDGLPVVTSLAGTDLVVVGQNGTSAAISLANLLDGETIDEASTAGPASDTDTIWVAQGGSTMLRQSFSAIWSWVAGNLPAYKFPVLELTTDTTLDASVHNGRLLVCSAPLVLTPAFPTMGSGFHCEVVNLSSGTVTFGQGFVVSSGASALATSQSATLRAISYSQGSVVFASVPDASAANSTATLPGQVTATSASGVTSSGVTISWEPPQSGGTATSFLLQYSISGTGNSSSLSIPAGNLSAVVGGLSAATTYTATVSAINAAGTGASSTAVTFTTATAASPPGQPGSPSVSNIQANSVQLAWSAPASGGAVTSYTVQYSTAPSSAWANYASGVSSTSAVITGLTAGTTYSFQVIANNQAGSGPVSSMVTASTASASSSVTSIAWNLSPAAQYAVGNGAIGVNVHVTPSSAAVQFGLSSSSAVQPTTWTAATYVNTDLWGAYVAVPNVAGTYYIWCEGTDGSQPTAYGSAITVS